MWCIHPRKTLLAFETITALNSAFHEYLYICYFKWTYPALSVLEKSAKMIKEKEKLTSTIFLASGTTSNGSLHGKLSIGKCKLKQPFLCMFLCTGLFWRFLLADLPPVHWQCHFCWLIKPPQASANILSCIKASFSYYLSTWVLLNTKLQGSRVFGLNFLLSFLKTFIIRKHLFSLPDKYCNLIQRCWSAANESTIQLHILNIKNPALFAFLSKRNLYLQQQNEK